MASHRPAEPTEVQLVSQGAWCAYRGETAGPGAASLPRRGLFMQAHVYCSPPSRPASRKGMERGPPLSPPRTTQDPQLLGALLGASEGKTAVVMMLSRYVSGLTSAPDWLHPSKPEPEPWAPQPRQTLSTAESKPVLFPTLQTQALPSLPLPARSLPGQVAKAHSLEGTKQLNRPAVPTQGPEQGGPRDSPH